MPAPKFKKVLIAPRCYEERHPHNDKPTGRYWARFPVNGRYTWKLLTDCQTKRDAIKQAQDADGPCSEGGFTSIAQKWVAAGCITKKQEWRQPSDGYKYEASLHAARLMDYFKNQHIDEVNRLIRCSDFQTWAARKFGTRAADKGAQTLSNIINFALFRLEIVELNFVRSNRDPKHRVKSHSRDRMPESADVIHQLADHFFTESQHDGRALRSEVFGWMTLFQMFTGCRTSELRRLRTDARKLGPNKFEPGYISDIAEDRKAEYPGSLFLLHLARSKGGINQYAFIGTEFAQMLECFWRWHADRFPESKVYFPGATGDIVDETGHVHAMKRACAKLGLPHITPHGLRSYCATKHLRDGKTHAEVAGIIGDKTAALIGSTYADAPGGAKLFWLPTKGLPAWSLWQDQTAKIARIA